MSRKLSSEFQKLANDHQKMANAMTELLKLVRAVHIETYGGIYVTNVDETNWFDKRNSILKDVNSLELYKEPT